MAEGKSSQENQVKLKLDEVSSESKLPWEKPEFASILPISATHGLPGGGPDGAANAS